MTLSVEAKVAASVAAGFVALTLGMIAQVNNTDLRAGPNGHAPTNDLGASMQMSQGEHANSLAGRADGEQNRHRPWWHVRQ